MTQQQLNLNETARKYREGRNQSKWADANIEDAYIAGYKAATKWIPLGDIPPKGEHLLLTTSKAIVKGDWYGTGWRTEWSKWVGSDLTLLEKKDVTHYMPLPKIPNL